MRRKPWVATLLMAAALSVLLAPSLVLLVGTGIRGTLRDPQTGFWVLVATFLIVGLFQFGLFFLVAGLITGWLSVLSASRGLALQLAAVLVPTLLFPLAAVVAIVWSNRGWVPLIQDTTPYFIGGFPAGLVIGVLTLLFATRVARRRSVTEGSA